MCNLENSLNIMKITLAANLGVVSLPKIYDFRQQMTIFAHDDINRFQV